MEQWRKIKDVKGRPLSPYEVSNRGRVRAFLTIGRSGRVSTPRLKATFPDRGGFLNVTLRTRPNSCNVYLVHQLVALAFLGPRPSKNHVVVHRNHDFKDNRVRNLAWVTRSEAMQRSMRHTPRRGPAKLTPAIVRRIRASDRTVKTIAARYGVTVQTIYGIRKRITWKDVT